MGHIFASEVRLSVTIMVGALGGVSALLSISDSHKLAKAPLALRGPVSEFRTHGSRQGGVPAESGAGATVFISTSRLRSNSRFVPYSLSTISVAVSTRIQQHAASPVTAPLCSSRLAAVALAL